MIDEPGDVPLSGRINELVRLEGHKVEVCIVVPGILFSPSLELPCVKHFPDILHKESPPEEEVTGYKRICRIVTLSVKQNITVSFLFMIVVDHSPPRE